MKVQVINNKPSIPNVQIQQITNNNKELQQI